MAEEENLNKTQSKQTFMSAGESNLSVMWSVWQEHTLSPAPSCHVVSLTGTEQSKQIFTSAGESNSAVTWSVWQELWKLRLVAVYRFCCLTVLQGMFHCHGWYTAVACRRFSNAEFVNQTFKWEPVPWEGTHTHRGTQMQICTHRQTQMDTCRQTGMHTPLEQQKHVT